ncbi:PepSY-like domain-containing protein [uncultured Christiangramia sp.]|uniref:PepSY-like domain-containing protein n=1 Tax=uncultured Christiangramia sp. TaxID=503836 RepID=UPI00261903E9|nr:PepSY-like domain-containing protein [uncultured Christiangramia sp.]
MKSLKIAGLTVLMTLSANAQELNNEDVPLNLKSQFEKEYPNASEIEWEIENGLINVEFDSEGKEQEIWFDEAGNIIKTEREIDEKELPDAIKSKIKNSYSEFNIDDIEMKKENDKITYEIELKKGWTKKILRFEESGAIIQK